MVTEFGIRRVFAWKRMVKTSAHHLFDVLRSHALLHYIFISFCSRESVCLWYNSPTGFFSNLFVFTLSYQGNKTDIVICSYDDHFLVSFPSQILLSMFSFKMLSFVKAFCYFQVIATQIGSMGTILHARYALSVIQLSCFFLHISYNLCGGWSLYGKESIFVENLSKREHYFSLCPCTCPAH